MTTELNKRLAMLLHMAYCKCDHTGNVCTWCHEHDFKEPWTRGVAHIEWLRMADRALRKHAITLEQVNHTAQQYVAATKQLDKWMGGS